MSEKYDEHVPVLLGETLDGLAIKPNGIYVDGTFGRGGHASAILDQLGPQGRLFAMDKDPEAIAYAQQYFSHEDRLVFQHGSFSELELFLKKEGVYGNVDGLLFDLGVSSPQLDNPARGFSFLRSGQLDMRMNPSCDQDAATWLANAREEELARVLWEYGEERFSRRIAKAIVKARAITPITTTGELAEIVAAAHPAWEKGKHPATKSFQAIRIFINQELDDIKIGLAQALDVLAVRGRLLVISFHSLEDRLVKQFMQHHARGDDLPRGLPVRSSELKPRLRCLGRAIKPSVHEMTQNPRARSAVLRIAEKLS